jgi:hypothetical protein
MDPSTSSRGKRGRKKKKSMKVYKNKGNVGPDAWFRQDCPVCIERLRKNMDPFRTHCCKKFQCKGCLMKCKVKGIVKCPLCRASLCPQCLHVLITDDGDFEQCISCTK